jgi:hypothetical protein
MNYGEKIKIEAEICLIDLLSIAPIKHSTIVSGINYRESLIF